MQPRTETFHHETFALCSCSVYLLVQSLHPSGYPIVNDPVYNHPAWGKDKGKGGVNPADMEQVS